VARTKDPYRIWLSEIMLQQTRVVAAIPYYERFLQGFRTFSRSPLHHRKRFCARGLVLVTTAAPATCKKRAANRGETRWTVSGAIADALALPGIGNYTAAAILSIAFGEKLAVLDGNVARVLARLGAIRGDSVSQRVGKSCKKQRTPA